MIRSVPETPLRATAVLLAGGRSTRMGRDKRHLEINGASLVQAAYDRLAELFSQVIISVSRPEVLVPGARHVRDFREDAGPLGAVISAMAEAACPLVFVMACDIPDPPRDVIIEMLEQAENYDVVVPVDTEGRCETLFAVYRVSLLPELRRLLESGEKRIRRIYPMVSTLYRKLPPGVTLKNLNTLEDVRGYLDCRRRDH